MVNRLKARREDQQITQEQLAHLVGVSRQSIISIEKGHYVPTSVLALKISSVMKIKVEDLFVLEESDWK